MDENQKKEETGLTRRNALKYTGLAAIGGLIAGNGLIGAGKALAEDDCGCPDGPVCNWTDDPLKTENYSYFSTLDKFHPFNSATKTTITPLGPNEMRITFMGSTIPPDMRKTQQMMSIFVEVGWDEKKQMPRDQFIFDCGSGVCTNYSAMNVGFGRMDKIFINHLHGDHTSDLTHIYDFGPAGDRRTPLYVFGPGPSGVESPKGSGKYYDDGTKAFCEGLRKMNRWHTESFSFQATSYPNYPTQAEIKEQWGLPHKPVPVEDDKWGDGYALVPIQLDWKKFGKTAGDNVAYHNKTTGVKITHFPVIHARKGSVGYKLEWKAPNGEVLSMIYSSDTKPETHCLEQAINKGKGIDVFIHEMIVPAQIWAMKISHLTVPPDPESPGVQWSQMVQNSSHTPQGAYGYLLSQIKPRPRLAVATHFPVANDTVACALKSVKAHCPWVKMDKDDGNFVWSYDLMVLRVTKSGIKQLRGDVSRAEFSATVNLPAGTANPPKYHTADGKGDPYAQIDLSTQILACEDGKCNFRDDGY